MSPQRIQRKRTAGWRMPDGAVYVGRPSKWGNPFAVGEPVLIRTPDGRVPWSERGDFQIEIEPTITVELAALLFRLAIVSGELDLPLHMLTGKDLACWCPLDQPCHADVLLEIANGGQP